MTEDRRCAWCRRMLPERGRTGRPRAYCSQRCRQWAWVARQRAAELQLSEHELVVTKAALDELHDQLYVLACAVEDAERDLAAAGSRVTKAELGELLAWVLDAARPVANVSLGAAPAPGRP